MSPRKEEYSNAQLIEMADAALREKDVEQARAYIGALNGDLSAEDKSVLQKFLNYAAEHGHEDLAVTLLEKGADPNARDEDGRTPLHIAADNSQKDLAVTLLEKGADPNARSNHGRTPLYFAATHGREDLAVTLLEKGADPNYPDNNGKTPGESTEDQSLLETLIAHGAYIPGQRAPTPEEKQRMKPEQLDSYNNARYAKNAVPGRGIG